MRILITVVFALSLIGLFFLTGFSRIAYLPFDGKSYAFWTIPISIFITYVIMGSFLRFINFRTTTILLFVLLILFAESFYGSSSYTPIPFGKEKIGYVYSYLPEGDMLLKRFFIIGIGIFWFSSYLVYLLIKKFKNLSVLQKVLFLFLLVPFEVFGLLTFLTSIQTLVNSISGK